MAKFAALARQRIAEELGLIAKRCYRFAWVVDFPMYEWDEQTRAVTFSHNPFSMPQGGLEALATQDPLEVLAYQYDIVCNGIELSSGAIRNHRPDIMVKAFALAGYGRGVLEERFGGMFRALHYGAPPHGGIAPGIDRIVMLIADPPNLREVTAFPLNQQAQELVLGARARRADVGSWHPGREGAWLRRLRHARRLAHQHRPRVASNPRSARLQGHRLACLRRHLARRGTQPAMEEIRSGRMPFAKLDVLHRHNLERILPRFNISGLAEETPRELNLAWHRLDAWPDVPPGMARLKRKLWLAPVSNGNISPDGRPGAPQQWPVGRHSRFRDSRRLQAKPVVYLSACAAFDLVPGDCMMVAAHSNDLSHAGTLSFRTAYIHRPTEHGRDQSTDLKPASDYDVVAASFPASSPTSSAVEQDFPRLGTGRGRRSADHVAAMPDLVRRLARAQLPSPRWATPWRRGFRRRALRPAPRRRRHGGSRRRSCRPPGVTSGALDRHREAGRGGGRKPKRKPGEGPGAGGGRGELNTPTPPLPRECSTPELRRRPDRPRERSMP